MSNSHSRAISETVSAASNRSFSSEPIVSNPAENRLLELIEREQLPGDVRQTLAGALTGDLTRQQLLFQAMIDTWPRLQKALAEIKRSVRKAPWQINPHKGRRDTEATPEAQARAEMLEDLFWVTEPRAAYSEQSAEGVIEEIVYGYFTGVHVIEAYWDYAKDGSVKPRAYKSVPARFYGYPYGNEEGEDRLMFLREGGTSGYQYEDFPEHHFLLSLNSGHPGHASVAAPLRALTGYWLAANFGLKWMLNFTQLYGIPFRWAEYSDNTVKSQVCSMLKNIGSAGWGAFPKGTKINFEDAGKAASQLPQKALIDMADTQCDIFMLGQTLTTSAGDKGSQALGNVHNGVKQDVIEGICDHVEDVLNRQLVPAIMELNYGDRENLPSFNAAFERGQDEKAMAERDEILLRAGAKFSTKWFNERHDLPQPESEEDTFSSTPTTPNGVQGEPATRSVLPIETKEEDGEDSKEKVAAMNAEALTVDSLSESVLEGLTGVSVEWLAPVKPFFQRLAALAMSKTVSDADFIQALEKAQGELPELFDVLDTEALEAAFTDAVGSGLAAGSADRYL